MPQVILTFPPAAPTALTNATNGDLPAPSMLAPQVELKLSFLERLQDGINWYLRRDRARAIAKHRDEWCWGVQSEIGFWDGFLRTEGAQYRKDYLERLDPDLPLQKELVKLVAAPKGSTIRILDVGAGPFTWVGRKSPDWNIEITALDPLADAYDQLLKAHGLNPPVRTTNVAAEDLRRAFRPATFDLVTVRNALDHSLDPVSAIRQMVEIVKPGGSVFLAHVINEATKNEYVGLHHWNFDLVGSDFVITGPNGETNVNQLLAGRANVSSELIDGYWLETAITRNSR